MAEWIEIQEEGQFDREIQQGELVAIFGDPAHIAWNITLRSIQGAAPILPLDKVLSVDTRNLPRLVEEREVKIIPTARFFFNGRKVNELSGNEVTVDQIQKSVEQLREAASREG